MGKITVRQKMLDAHEIFNDHFFSGLLNTPDFVFYAECYIDDVGSVWGYYEPPNIIGLTVNDKIYTTLLHEMIHQYQNEFNLIDKDHGTTFRKYTKYIECILNIKKGSI